MNLKYPTCTIVMYHCHVLSHEDKGMMGQFIILDPLNISINETENDVVDISIYPNPSQDYITIDLGTDGDEVTTISMVSLLGKTVISVQNDNSNSVNMNVSSVAAGEYLIVLQYANRPSYATKFIKE